MQIDDHRATTIGHSMKPTSKNTIEAWAAAVSVANA